MLEGMTPTQRKAPCKVRAVLESLDSKDQVILVNAISNESWGPASLARELTSRGIPISEKPIVAHRRKACSCVR
jgi:DNA-binding HxlR family transcriptional regulator